MAYKQKHDDNNNNNNNTLVRLFNAHATNPIRKDRALLAVLRSFFHTKSHGDAQNPKKPIK